VPYASTTDVSALYGPLTGDQLTKTVRLLEFASALVKQQVPLVDERLADGSLSADAVASVITAMVVRVLRNPEGRRQVTESAGPFSESWAIDQAVSSGVLYLSETERAALMPPTLTSWAGSLSYGARR
jgi:hypothetical protein